jgi:hypothetical protein
VATLCINIRASHAYQTGDSHWCPVTDRGDVISWDCDYDSNDECLAGHRYRWRRILRDKSVLAPKSLAEREHRDRHDTGSSCSTDPQTEAALNSRQLARPIRADQGGGKRRDMSSYRKAR